MTEASEAYQRDIHRQIAERLKDLVPSDPTLPPHPYLRRHLAEHAAQGEVFDDDHVTPGLLAWESSSQVRRLLAAQDTTNERRQWLCAWAALEPFALNTDPLSRLSSLRLARHATLRPPVETAPAAHPAAFGAPVPVSPLWSDRVVPTPAWTASPAEVTALATLHTSDGAAQKIATGDDTGTLRLLRTDGRLTHIPVHLHSGAITHLLALRGGLLVTAGTDGRVMAVQEEGGRLTHHQVARRERTWVSSLTTYQPHGRPLLLLAAFSDGVVEAVDLGRFHRHPLPLERLTDPSALLCGIRTAGGEQRLLFSARSTVHHYDGSTPEVHCRHQAPVRALIALSQAGRYVVGDESGRVTLCDLEADGPLAVGRHDAVQAGSSPAPVTALHEVVLADGPALVSASGDGTLRLWRLPDLRPVAGVLAAHTAPVNAMTRLPGRRHDRLLSGGADHVVRGWSVDEATFGQEPQTWNRVTACAVSPSAPHLLAVARASRVILRDLATGTETTRIKGRRISALAWLRINGRRLLAVALDDLSIICVDPETNRQAGPPMTGHNLRIRTLVTLPTLLGERLASAGADGRVCVWEPATGERLALFDDHDLTVRCLATHQNAERRLLASGGSDGNIRIWNADTLEQHSPTIKCDQGLINDLAFVTPDDGGPIIAAAGRDGTLKLWDAETREPVRTLACGDGELSAVTSVQLRYGRTALAAAGKTSVHLWDATTAQPLLQIVTGSPITSLKTVQDTDDGTSSILLASGEAGPMAVRLHHNLL
ncbi:WD40 repeat domain-containing protein [Streptomyces sp. NPDC057509]|uniref:WD40 repeat domain-containing protein n=1 Tax=Streptomyces sp. NPDC057509 TaxID=3346152 RepID=UPI0036C132E5